MAAATLTNPGAHQSAEYTLGPQALSMAQVAEIIATVTDRDIRHVNVSKQCWIDLCSAAGVSATYAARVGGLFGAIANGEEARPHSDI